MNCKLCTYKQKQILLQQILNKALFQKYSQSQDTYYIKIVQQFVDNQQSPMVIDFKNQLSSLNDDEFLKKTYIYPYLNIKLCQLAKFYKYHKDVPRQFIKPLIKIINRFHDNMRRIHYYKVKRMLHKQQGKNVPFEMTQEQESVISETSSVKQNEITNLDNFLQRIHNNTILILIKEFQKVQKLNFEDVENQSNFLENSQEYQKLDHLKYLSENQQVKEQLQNQLKKQLSIHLLNQKQIQITQQNILRTQSQNISNQTLEILQQRKKLLPNLEKYSQRNHQEQQNNYNKLLNKNFSTPQFIEQKNSLSKIKQSNSQKENKDIIAKNTLLKISNNRNSLKFSKPLQNQYSEKFTQKIQLIKTLEQQIVSERKIPLQKLKKIKMCPSKNKIKDKISIR